MKVVLVGFVFVCFVSVDGSAAVADDAASQKNPCSLEGCNSSVVHTGISRQCAVDIQRVDELLGRLKHTNASCVTTTLQISPVLRGLTLVPEMNISGIQSLENLTQLRISPYEVFGPAAPRLPRIALVYEPSLSSLPMNRLYFNVPIAKTIELTSVPILRELCHQLTSLSHLDLSHTYSFTFGELFPILNVVNSPHLRYLNFSHSTERNQNLNLTRLGEEMRYPGELRVADLSGNGILTLQGNRVCPYFPKLLYLDLSFNLLTVVGMDGHLYYEIAMMPHLSVVHLERQASFTSASTVQCGCLQKRWPRPEDIELLVNKTLTEKTCTYKNSPDFGNQTKVTTVSQFCTEMLLIFNSQFERNTRIIANQPVPSTDELMLRCNAIPFLPNHAIFCGLYKYANPQVAKMACDMIPTWQELIKLFEMGCLPLFNFTPALEEVYADDISALLDNDFPYSVFYNQSSPFRFCLTASNIKVLSIGYNKGSVLTSSYLQRMFPFVYDVTMSPSIRSIDLQDDGFTFTGINSSVFSPSVEHLYLQRNTITLKDNSVCTDFPNLTTIFLDSSNLNVTHKNAFTNCPKLTMISMADNKLLELNFDLDLNISSSNGQTNYFTLNVTDNLLEVLEDSFMASLDGLQASGLKVTVDMRNNVFSCRCETRNFVRWVQNTKVNLIGKETYLCHGETGTVTLSSVDLSKLAVHCRNQILYGLEFSAVTLVLTLACTLLVVLLYKRRFIIQLEWRRFRSKNVRNDSREIIYDAYLNYIAEDRFWVHSVLMKTLEDLYGFKLCVHYRDFPVGGLISDAIVEFLGKSRVMISITSKRALEKRWFQFECERARQMQADNPNFKIITILLSKKSDLSGDHFTRLLQSSVLLIWPGELNQSNDAACETTATGGAVVSNKKTNIKFTLRCCCILRKLFSEFGTSTQRAEKLFWYKLRLELHKSLSPKDSACCRCLPGHKTVEAGATAEMGIIAQISRPSTTRGEDCFQVVYEAHPAVRHERTMHDNAPDHARAARLQIASQAEVGVRLSPESD